MKSFKSAKIHYCLLYFVVGVAISVYTNLDWTKFVHFLFGSFITFCFFVGAYFCLKDISSKGLPVRIMKVIGVIIFLSLIYMSSVVSSMSGFHSSYCYNLVAQDLFTGEIRVHCNYPPWHTEIIGGEGARKVLRDDCLSRKSEFYEEHPDYCDVYDNRSLPEDWITGPNP